MREKFKDLMFSGKEAGLRYLYLCPYLNLYIIPQEKMICNPIKRIIIVSWFWVALCCVLKEYLHLCRKFGSLKRFKKGQGHHVAIT